MGLCLLIFVDLLNQKNKLLEKALAELVFLQRARHHGKPYWFSYPWNRVQVPDSPSTGREKGQTVKVILDTLVSKNKVEHCNLDISTP